MVTAVYFIGTGPGDPELLTLKGQRIIEQADVLVYADSLINQKVLERAKPEAVIFKSASLTLEETHQIISEAVKQGKNRGQVAERGCQPFRGHPGTDGFIE